MPYAMRKIPNKRCYKVFNKTSKRVFAKCATKTKALRQLGLLRGLTKKKR